MNYSRYANLERALSTGSCDPIAAASNTPAHPTSEAAELSSWYRTLANALFDIPTSYIAGEMVSSTASIIACRELCVNLAEEISAVACANIREVAARYDTEFTVTELWVYYDDGNEEDRWRRTVGLDIGDAATPVFPEFVLGMLFDQIDTTVAPQGFGVTIKNKKSGALSRVSVYLDLRQERLGDEYVSQVQFADVRTISGPTISAVSEETVSSLETDRYVSKLTLLTADTSVALRTLSASFSEGDYIKVDFPENGRHPLEICAEVGRIFEKTVQQDKPVIVTTMSNVVCDCICTRITGRHAVDLKVTNLHAVADGTIFMSVAEAGSTGEFAYEGISDLGKAAAHIKNERERALNTLPADAVEAYNANPLTISKITLNTNNK